MKRVMWWILGVASFPVIVFVLCYVTGSFMPREHVASREVVLKQPAAEVWALVHHVADLPQWRPSVTAVEILEGDAASPKLWIEKSGRDALTLRLESSEPPRKRVTRIADDSLPFGGTWTFELTPAADGTRLRITEEGFINPPPFRVLAKYIFGHAKSIEDYLKDLAKKTGSEPALLP